MAFGIPGWRRPSSRVRGLAAVLVLAIGSTGAAPASKEPAVEVVASRRGFRPATLEGRKGEVLHLELRSADHEHCFAIDEFRVEKRVVPGRSTSLDLTPDKAGRFTFYCCVENGKAQESERGTLVVSE